MNVNDLYACPCCGYQTIAEVCTNEICHICYWEDDPVQSANPWYSGGANTFSLFDSQQNYDKFGACEKDFIKNVKPVKDDDIKSDVWRKLEVHDKEYNTTVGKIDSLWASENAISFRYWERHIKDV